MRRRRRRNGLVLLAGTDPEHLLTFLVLLFLYKQGVKEEDKPVFV